MFTFERWRLTAGASSVGGGFVRRGAYRGVVVTGSGGVVYGAGGVFRAGRYVTAGGVWITCDGFGYCW